MPSRGPQSGSDRKVTRWPLSLVRGGPIHYEAFLGRRLLPRVLLCLLRRAPLEELALTVQLRHRGFSLAAAHACPIVVDLYRAAPPTGEIDGDPARASIAVAAPLLEGGDVRCRRALRPLLGVVADLCALGQRLKAATLD